MFHNSYTLTACNNVALTLRSNNKLMSETDAPIVIISMQPHAITDGKIYGTELE